MGVCKVGYLCPRTPSVSVCLCVFCDEDWWIRILRKNIEPVAKVIKKGDCCLETKLVSRVCVFLGVGLSCQPLVHLKVLVDPLELEASPQVVQVGGQDTCHWGLQGGVEASWEACLQEGGQQGVDQTSYVPALAGLVPLVLSVLGDEGPWGDGPWGGNQGALQHLVEVLRDGLGGHHGGEEVLHGVARVLQGACLVERAQGGVLSQGPVPVLVLGPEQRLQQQQQLVAPSAAAPSFQHISAAPCGRPVVR